MRASAPPARLSIRHVVWSVVAVLVFAPLALWDVSFTEVRRILGQADWRPVSLAVALFMLTSLAKTARWGAFFRARLSFVSLLSALAIGQWLNFLLPARLGDAARIYVLRRREGEQIARLLGTLGAEKLTDLLMVASSALFVALAMPLPEWMSAPALRLGIGVLGVVLFVGVMFMQQARLRQVVARLGARLLRLQPSRVEHQFDLTLDGLSPLQRRVFILKILPWSLIVWTLMATTNYVLFLALPIQASWLASVVLLVVLQIGVAVPSTPAKLGVFQALVNLTLALFGIDRDLALSYGLLLHLVIVVSQTALAGPFLWQEFIHLRASRVRSP